MKSVAEIMSKIPSDWKEIKKENYPLYGIYSSGELNILSAYQTHGGNVVTVNEYSDETFIELYDKQIKEISTVLKGKNWKDISTMNPLGFGYKMVNGTQIYYSCFEISSSNQVVALQIFLKQTPIIGFLTAIQKPKEFSFEHLVQNESLLKQILSLA